MNEVPGEIDSYYRNAQHPTPIPALEPAHSGQQQHPSENGEGNAHDSAHGQELKVGRLVHGPSPIQQGSGLQQGDSGIGGHDGAEEEKYAQREKSGGALV